MKKIVYIAHPVAGDVQHNMRRLNTIVRFINLFFHGYVPFVPYYSDIASMDDSDKEFRAKGIANTEEFFRRRVMDELWLFGPEVSPGMRAEIEMADELGIPVYPMSTGTQFFRGRNFPAAPHPVYPSFPHRGSFSEGGEK